MKDEIQKREVGEHISFSAHFEPEKTKDLGEGVVEAIITSENQDHHGETIEMSGVDTTAYHGTVLYGHDYEGLPIGKTVSITKMKSKIKAKFQLAVEEYPFAKTVYNMIKSGYLTDVSIGGLVEEWSDDFKTIKRMVMKEFSVVPIGANPKAMITMVKSLGVNADDVKKEYQDFVQKSMLDKFKGMPDNELNQAIKVLESLVATLKESAKPQSSAGEPEIRSIKRVRLLKTAKAVNQESERVIRIIKLKSAKSED